MKLSPFFFLSSLTWQDEAWPAVQLVLCQVRLGLRYIRFQLTTVYEDLPQKCHGPHTFHPLFSCSPREQVMRWFSIRLNFLPLLGGSLALRAKRPC